MYESRVCINQPHTLAILTDGCKLMGFSDTIGVDGTSGLPGRGFLCRFDLVKEPCLSGRIRARLVAGRTESITMPVDSLTRVDVSIPLISADQKGAISL
jgi:hypothetical protein